jgi:hypothetical protein
VPSMLPFWSPRCQTSKSLGGKVGGNPICGAVEGDGACGWSWNWNLLDGDGQLLNSLGKKKRCAVRAFSQSSKPTTEQQMRGASAAAAIHDRLLHFGRRGGVEEVEFEFAWLHGPLAVDPHATRAKGKATSMDYDGTSRSDRHVNGKS